MAIIQGAITDESGNPIARPVKFYAVGNPGNTVAVAKPIVVISDSRTGAFAVPLDAGFYKVNPGTDSQFHISVPSDSSTYGLGDVFVTDAAATISTVSTAKSDESGTVKTVTTVADPTVYITSEVDDLVDVDELEITISSSSWTWTHGYNYPIVQVLDSSRNVMEANVTHTASNTVQVDHASNKTGFIVVHR